jgi:hypothetical protein
VTLATIIMQRLAANTMATMHAAITANTLYVLSANVGNATHRPTS